LKTKTLKAACVAVSLATAWGSQVDADLTLPAEEIQLTITPSNNLSHVYFLYGAGTTSLYPVVTVQPLPNLVAGETTTEDILVPAISPVSPIARSSFYVMGLYDETNKLVTIGLNSTVANAAIGNTDFNTEFSPFTEAAFATALLSNDTATLVSFAETPQFQGQDNQGYITVGDSGQLVNYSSASAGGSISSQVVVPEPFSVFLAGTGVLSLVASHQKQKPIYQPGRKNIRDP